jgi:hypothetical protein
VRNRPNNPLSRPLRRPTLCTIAYAGDLLVAFVSFLVLGSSVLMTLHRSTRVVHVRTVFTSVSGRFARTNASDLPGEREHDHVALQVLDSSALVLGPPRTADRCTRRPVADRFAKLRRWQSSSRSRASGT